jgi:hypothetical protein
LTAVATVGVGIQAMFFSDYHVDGFEGKDHVFTNIQKDTRMWIDKNIYGIDDSTTTSTNPPQTKVDQVGKDTGRPQG